MGDTEIAAEGAEPILVNDSAEPILVNDSSASDEDEGNTGSRKNLAALIDKYFTLIDPGQNRTSSQKRKQPERACSICGTFSRRGSYQVFVCHILGHDLNGNSSQKCTLVTEPIRQEFQQCVNANSIRALSDDQPSTPVSLPEMTDEELLSMDDFRLRFWMKSTFRAKLGMMRSFGRKRKLPEAEIEALYQQSKTAHRKRYDNLKYNQASQIQPVETAPPAASQVTSPVPAVLDAPKTINNVLAFRKPEVSRRPGRPVAMTPIRTKTYPHDDPDRMREWKRILPWVFYQNGCMYCSLCQARNKVNNFVTGTKDFVTATLQMHAGVYHVKDLGSVDRPIVEAFRQAKELQKQTILRIIEAVFLIGKKNYAFSHLEDICNLGQGLGTQYVGYNSCREFMRCIALVLRRRIVTAAKHSPFIGLMLDESTDCSKTSILILYLRYSEKGKAAVTKFLAVIELNAKNAEGISKTVIDYIQEQELNPAKIISIASDGAAVVAGTQTGVAVRIRNAFNIFLLIAHCIGHKHALCVSNAASEDELADYFEPCMRDIINYFAHSSSRKLHLSQSQEELGLEVLQMLRYVVTRWLSRGEATLRIYRNYPALVKDFGEDSSSGCAITNLNTMLSQKFVSSLCFFADFLERQNTVSRIFQHAHVCIRDLKQTVDMIRKSIETLYLGQTFLGGSRFRKLQSAMTADRGEFEFEQVPLICNMEEHKWVMQNAKKFASKVHANFEERFPHNTILASLDIFDIENLLPQDDCFSNLQVLLDEFGSDKITDGRIWPKLVDPDRCRVEIDLLYEKMKDANHRQLKNATFWLQHLSMEDSITPSLDILVQIWQMQCLSTVVCEQGFSRMNIIKTRLRNLIKVSQLDDLMQVSINGPDLNDVDGKRELFDEVFDVWMKAKHRNIRKSHRTTRKRVVKASKSSALEVLESDFLDPDTVHEDTSSDDEQVDIESEKEMPSQDELYAQVGVFQPECGWMVLPEPLPEQFDELIRQGLRGYKIAHKWDENWDTGIWKAKNTRNGKTWHEVKYPSDGKTYKHELPLNGYGMDKIWCLIKPE
jgi:hypothetical protein